MTISFSLKMQTLVISNNCPLILTIASTKFTFSVLWDARQRRTTKRILRAYKAIRTI